MGKHSPLTSRFQDIQNRIDDAMFAMNTFGHAGGGTLKKKESFSNKEEHVKPVPDLVRGMQSPSEQLEDGFPLFSASGNGFGYKKPAFLQQFASRLRFSVSI